MSESEPESDLNYTPDDYFRLVHPLLEFSPRHRATFSAHKLLRTFLDFSLSRSLGLKNLHKRELKLGDLEVWDDDGLLVRIGRKRSDEKDERDDIKNDSDNDVPSKESDRNKEKVDKDEDDKKDDKKDDKEKSSEDKDDKKDDKDFNESDFKPVGENFKESGGENSTDSVESVESADSDFVRNTTEESSSRPKNPLGKPVYDPRPRKSRRLSKSDDDFTDDNDAGLVAACFRAVYPEFCAVCALAMYLFSRFHIPDEYDSLEFLVSAQTLDLAPVKLLKGSNKLLPISYSQQHKTSLAAVSLLGFNTKDVNLSKLLNTQFYHSQARLVVKDPADLPVRELYRMARTKMAAKKDGANDSKSCKDCNRTISLGRTSPADVQYPSKSHIQKSDKDTKIDTSSTKIDEGNKVDNTSTNLDTSIESKSACTCKSSVFFPLRSAQVEPPRELVDQIFPFANELLVHMQGQEQLARVLRMLRRVLVQDMVVIRRKYPENALLKHPIFNLGTFSQFARQVENRGLDDDFNANPTSFPSTDFEAAARLLSNFLHAQRTHCQDQLHALLQMSSTTSGISILMTMESKNALPLVRLRLEEHERLYARVQGSLEQAVHNTQHTLRELQRLAGIRDFSLNTPLHDIPYTNTPISGHLEHGHHENLPKYGPSEHQPFFFRPSASTFFRRSQPNFAAIF